MAQQSSPIIDELDDVQLHLLLAASGQENLLINLQDFTSFATLKTSIRSFCDAPTVARSVHFVPPNLFEKVQDLEGVLAHLFLTEEDQKDVAHIGEVPQVLVMPLLEGFATPLHIGLKAVLREKRFTLKEHVYNLPDGFLVVGVVQDWYKLPNYIVDAFGLSLEIDRATSSSNVTLPPLVPVAPPAHYTPKLRLYAADLYSAVRLHPLIQNTLLTARCNHGYLIKIATLWIRLKMYEPKLDTVTEKPSAESPYLRDVDIRPNDIADILSACVMHRLRVRPPELRWHRFWNTDPPSAEAMRAEEALREGIRPDFSGVIETILSKV